MSIIASGTKAQTALSHWTRSQGALAPRPQCASAPQAPQKFQIGAWVWFKPRQMFPAMLRAPRSRRCIVLSYNALSQRYLLTSIDEGGRQIFSGAHNLQARPPEMPPPGGAAA